MAQGIGLALSDQNFRAAWLALGQKAEMRGIGDNSEGSTRHGFRQCAGMHRGWNEMFVTKVHNKHRHVDGGKACMGKRLDDPGVNDHREIDARIMQVLSGLGEIYGM